MDMQTVSVSRTIAADADSIREVLADVEPFMQSGGFSEARATDEEIYLRQNLGLATIELELELVDDPTAALVYHQREGIFNEMETRYEIEGTDRETTVTATTSFELGGVVGSVLDATIVKRKRRSELNAQFDYLEAQVAGD